MHSGNKSRTKSEREKGTGEILEAVTTGYFPTLKSDTKWDKYLKRKSKNKQKNHMQAYSIQAAKKTKKKSWKKPEGKNLPQRSKDEKCT